jgi:hypothetical protein
MLTRIDASDVDQPTRDPEVNIPGELVGIGPGGVIYTRESWWTSNDTRTYLHALLLGDGVAYLQSSLRLEGYAGQLAFRGAYAYTLTSSYDNTDGTSTSSIVAVDLTDPAQLPSASVQLPSANGYGWWGSLSTAGRRLFMQGGDGLVVFDLADPMAPAFSAFYRTHGWSYRVEVSGDTAYLPIGSAGVEMITLE